MKALVKYEEGPGNMEIREVPEPEAAKGMVKIKVVEAGICGSDLHIYHSDIAIPVRPPVTTGHEFSGIVAEVGEGLRLLSPATEWCRKRHSITVGNVITAGKGFTTCVLRERHWGTGSTAFLAATPLCLRTAFTKLRTT